MFPLFFPYRWTRNDWQETCGAEYSADRDNDFISLFAHYQLFTCTVFTLLDLLPTTVWRKSKVFLLSKWSARQAAVMLHVSVIFWPQSRCSTVSQDVLRVIHHMNCCLPLPPTKKPSNVWLPILCSKIWWQVAKFQKFVQTRNTNIQDQRYRYHCCVPGSCLGGSDIFQVSPHMRWINSYGG